MYLPRWPHLILATGTLLGVRAPALPAQPVRHTPALPQDSLAALRSAKVALQRFQQQFDALVGSQRITGAFGPTATCTEQIGLLCLDAENGGLPYGVYSARPIFQRSSATYVPEMDRKTTFRLHTDFLKALDKAAKIIPGDRWIAGQRVRRFIDIGDTSGVHQATDQCQSDAWWCAALTGYAAAITWDFDRSDSAFSIALDAMPVDERCRWEDITPLLDKESRAWFSKLSCAERHVELPRLWWLADPLYLLPGNEREREHYVREMYYLLEADAIVALNTNQGQALARSSPATVSPGALQLDALREVVIRMGIPGFSVPIDNGRDPVVAQGGRGGGAGGPRTVIRSIGGGGIASIRRLQAQPTLLSASARPTLSVYQFPTPRYHFIPDLDAIQNPLRATRDEWTPLDLNARELFSPHFGSDFSPLDHQVAYFRRGDSAVLIAAADVSRDSTLYAQGAFNAALVRATDERTPPQIWHVLGDVMFLWAVTVPLDSALIDLEVTTPIVGVARARYASGPRPLPAQRVGVSDLLVMEKPQDPLPTTLESAMLGIAGGVRVPILSTIGVFWETYGLQDGDAVTFTVAASPAEPPSAASRLTHALKLGGGGDSTRVQWSETVATGGDRTGRSVNLDLSQLPLGFYALHVTVSVAGQKPVTAEQRIEIVRPLH